MEQNSTTVKYIKTDKTMQQLLEQSGKLPLQIIETPEDKGKFG